MASSGSQPHTLRLVQGAVALIGATALSGALGLAFWALAARVLPAEQIGRDGALVTALVALSSACQLNLFAALPRFVPGMRSGARHAIRLAYVTCMVVAGVAASAFVLVAPELATDLEVLHDQPLLGALFVLGVVAWSLMAVQDGALAAVRRADWLPREQLLYNALRIGVLVLAAAAGAAHGIVLAWVLPLAVVLPVGARILFGRALRTHAARGREGAAGVRLLARGPLARFLAVDAAAFVLRQAALGATPLVVLSIVGGTVAAAFTLPFAVVVGFDLLFVGAATSFTVEAAQHGARLDELLRVLLRRFLAPMLVAAALLAAAAPLVLAPFGAAYVEDGSAALRLLAAASAVRVLLVLGEALLRLRGEAWPILAFSVAMPATLLVVAPPLVEADGVTGGAAAWLAANVVAGLVALPAARRALVEARRT